MSIKIFDKGAWRQSIVNLAFSLIASATVVTIASALLVRR